MIFFPPDVGKNTHTKKNNNKKNQDVVLSSDYIAVQSVENKTNNLKSFLEQQWELKGETIQNCYEVNCEITHTAKRWGESENVNILFVRSHSHC